MICWQKNLKEILNVILCLEQKRYMIVYMCIEMFNVAKIELNFLNLSLHDKKSRIKLAL